MVASVPLHTHFGRSDFHLIFPVAMSIAGKPIFIGGAIKGIVDWRAAAIAKAEKLASAAEKPKEDGLSYEERKRLTNRRKTLPKKRDEVLADVETLEERKASLLARYAEDGFFERTSAEDLRKLEAEQASLDGEIQAKMTLWEELEKELAELDALLGPSTSA